MPIKFAIINVSFDLPVMRLHDLFVLLSQWTMWDTCVTIKRNAVCTIFSYTLDTGPYGHKTFKFCTRTQKLSNQNEVFSWYSILVSFFQILTQTLAKKCYEDMPCPLSHTTLEYADFVLLLSITIIQSDWHIQLLQHYKLDDFAVRVRTTYSNV